MARSSDLAQMKPCQCSVLMSSQRRLCGGSSALNSREFCAKLKGLRRHSAFSVTVAGRSQDGYSSTAHPGRGVFVRGASTATSHIEKRVNGYERKRASRFQG